MLTSSFIIVQLHGAYYGFDSAAVVELFSLPELVPIAEAPSYVAGVLNLRGRILPVIDLDQRLGRGRHIPDPHDAVVVLDVDGHQFGVIVDDVLEVMEVETDAIVPVPSYGELRDDQPKLIAGIALSDGEIVPVIDLGTLLVTSEGIIELESQEPEAIAPAVDLTFAPDAGADARALFRERALALIGTSATEDREEQRGLAVFRLGAEHFAVDVGLVQEFAAAPHITPVPCCPPQIVGQINLRGDIVTLVDIRAALEMPVPPPGPMAQAMVVTVDDLRAGVIVDAVLAIADIPSDAVKPAPAGARAAEREYLVGTVEHLDRVVSLLDLARMFRSGVFHVDEEVG